MLFSGEAVRRTSLALFLLALWMLLLNTLLLLPLLLLLLQLLLEDKLRLVFLCGEGEDLRFKSNDPNGEVDRE